MMERKGIDPDRFLDRRENVAMLKKHFGINYSAGYLAKRAPYLRFPPRPSKARAVPSKERTTRMLSTVTTAAAITYDYSQVGPETVDRLRKHADRIQQKLRQTVRSTVSAIIEIGQDLLAVQEHLPHGQFGAWVEAECRFTDRAARRYMRVAEFAADKTDTVSVLSPTTLYMLTAKSAPKEIVADIRARVEAGEVLDEARIKMKFEEAKSERQAAADKAFRDRHRAETKQRRLKREEQENQAEQERRQLEAKAKAKAIAIIQRFGLEGAQFLLTLEPEWHVLRLLKSEVAQRTNGPNSDGAGGPLGVAPDRLAVEQAGGPE
jgi:hypothetical protein